MGRVEQARTLVEVVRADAVSEHEQRIRGEYRRAEGGELVSVRAEQHERKGHEQHSRACKYMKAAMSTVTCPSMVTRNACVIEAQT